MQMPFLIKKTSRKIYLVYPRKNREEKRTAATLLLFLLDFSFDFRIVKRESLAKPASGRKPAPFRKQAKAASLPIKGPKLF
jgi:hypothetical protein